MPRFILDTNSVSHALRGNPPSVREHLRHVPMAQVSISSITEAELLFGLALKPQATKLAELANQFLLGVSVLPWDSAAARAYADLRSATWKKGHPLAAMDMLVAAHAFASGLTFVTSDRSSVHYVPASASPTGPSLSDLDPFSLRLLSRMFCV
jgi:tRNA(fMet)-specific endonuclease VapC